MPPRWYHARTIKSEKPAGLESSVLTFYQGHSEHRVIVGIMQQILVSHQAMLGTKEISYDQWYEGEIESDIWLNSTDFTLPLDFSLFTHLREVPSLQHCIPIDWQANTACWCNSEMNLANWCQQLAASKAMVSLIHYRLIIQG